ncbi:LysR family transcriptional regulator [Pseudomonas huanghezhanensis]|uniref:LysR family transcriptional regulator n=1 Tax=Pseudomonas huanghezhanensis TaxID=3002903 RepID=UPI0022863A72|nr:LysR family transcriptional regulator [Pseudomonas sp. BSw22131]
MNKLELLKTFIRVAELSSFTQASETLGLPRSTVSENVRLLEALLDTRLLQRTTRKVQTTPDGQVLYERSKDLLAQMDELESLFRNDDAALSGRLRVDMPTAIARKLVMPRIGEFITRYPLIDLEISSTDRRVDLVREGFDCVMRAGELADTSLVARYVGDFRLSNVVSADYASRHGVPRTLADLQQHRLVHYVSNFGATPAFEYHRDGEYHRVKMPCSVTVNNGEAYEAGCLGGLGIIQAPIISLQSFIDTGELIEVLPDYLPSPMPVSLLYAHRRHLPARCRAFMQWMEALLREHGAARSDGL